jgi:DeoR family glycerol-3-phosphate regulon repressor
MHTDDRSVNELAIDGIMDANRSATSIKRAMLGQSDERYLLVDHFKFNQRMLSVVEPLGAIDVLISDIPPTGTLLDALTEAGVQLLAGDDAATVPLETRQNST